MFRDDIEEIRKAKKQCKKYVIENPIKILPSERDNVVLIFMDDKGNTFKKFAYTGKEAIEAKYFMRNLK